MEFRVRVHITHRSDRQELTEAFSPYLQLGNLGDEFTDEDKAALEKMAGRFGKKGWSQDFDRATILEGRRCLRMLRVELVLQSEAKADPEWVRQTKELEAAGKVPFVKDPNQAVQMINEIRVRQIRKIDRAMEILEVALDGLDSLVGQALALTEAVQEQAG